MKNYHKLHLKLHQVDLLENSAQAHTIGTKIIHFKITSIPFYEVICFNCYETSRGEYLLVLSCEHCLPIEIHK